MYLGSCDTSAITRRKAAAGECDGGVWQSHELGLGCPMLDQREQGKQLPPLFF